MVYLLLLTSVIMTILATQAEAAPKNACDVCKYCDYCEGSICKANDWAGSDLCKGCFYCPLWAYYVTSRTLWDKNEEQQLRSLNDSTNNYEPTTQTLLPKYIHKSQYILSNSSEDVLICLLAYMVAFVLFLIRKYLPLIIFW